MYTISSNMPRRYCTLYHNTPAMIRHFPPYEDYSESPDRIVAIEMALKNVPFETMPRYLATDRSGAYIHEEIVPQADSVWNRCDTVLVEKGVSMKHLVDMYGSRTIEGILNAIPEKGSVVDKTDADIYWSEGSFEASSIAVAASIQAVSDVLQRKTNTAFCIVRPPGHHCFNLPTGFCVFNNVVFAAHTALQKGLRVAILDWDYHFGDGTALALRPVQNVMFASLHCKATLDGHPTYPPNTADDLKGAGLLEQTQGRMFNIQWDTDTANDAAYKYAIEQVILPAFQRFDPDILLISAGFDAVQGDALAGMRLSPHVFGHMANTLANHFPTVAILEGGYDPELLGKCAVSTVEGLRGTPSEGKPTPLFVAHKKTVDTVHETLARYNRI